MKMTPRLWKALGYFKTTHGHMMPQKFLPWPGFERNKSSLTLEEVVHKITEHTGATEYSNGEKRCLRAMQETINTLELK